MAAVSVTLHKGPIVLGTATWTDGAAALTGYVKADISDAWAYLCPAAADGRTRKSRNVQLLITSGALIGKTVDTSFISDDGLGAFTITTVNPDTGV